MVLILGEKKKKKKALKPLSQQVAGEKKYSLFLSNEQFEIQAAQRELVREMEKGWMS